LNEHRRIAAANLSQSQVTLTWPGKGEPVSLPPAQLLRGAAIGESEGAGSWRNQLIQGDNAQAMSALAPGLAGQVDLLYADPPFATGLRRAAPDGTAFDDRWPDGLPSYLSFMLMRLQLFHTLLAPTGSLLLHCDPRTDWALRCLVDEVFGPGRFLNQIIWHYTGGGRSQRHFSRKHDVLLWVAKGDRWTFHIDAIRRPYRPTSGYARSGITARSGKRYLPHPDGTPMDDVWHIPMLNPLAGERLGYPTQKPERLLERIILAASNPDDLVADFFCGSGTTLAVAERLGRRWLGCDASAAAIATTRSRLAGLNPPAMYDLWTVESIAVQGHDG
jgi:DNA modification methylase